MGLVIVLYCVSKSFPLSIDVYICDLKMDRETGVQMISRIAKVACLGSGADSIHFP